MRASLTIPRILFIFSAALVRRCGPDGVTTEIVAERTANLIEIMAERRENLIDSSDGTTESSTDLMVLVWRKWVLFKAPLMSTIADGATQGLVVLLVWVVPR